MGNSFMGKMLYEECSICKGTGKVSCLTNVPPGSECPGCKVKRVIETGRTVGDLEISWVFQSQCKEQKISGKMLLAGIPSKAIQSMKAISNWLLSSDGTPTEQVLHEIERIVNEFHAIK